MNGETWFGVLKLNELVVSQGSLYYKPKPCTSIREIPQIYNTFTLFDPLRNLGNLMTPRPPEGVTSTSLAHGLSFASPFRWWMALRMTATMMKKRTFPSFIWFISRISPLLAKTKQRKSMGESRFCAEQLFFSGHFHEILWPDGPVSVLFMHHATKTTVAKPSVLHSCWSASGQRKIQCFYSWFTSYKCIPHWECVFALVVFYWFKNIVSMNIHDVCTYSIHSSLSGFDTFCVDVVLFRTLQMKPMQKRSSFKLFVGWNGHVGMLMEVQIFPSKWPFGFWFQYIIY